MYVLYEPFGCRRRLLDIKGLLRRRTRCKLPLFFFHHRFAGRVEVHHQGNGSAAPNRLIGVIRYHHICHHWTGVLLRSVAQDLLQVRVNSSY